MRKLLVILSLVLLASCAAENEESGRLAGTPETLEQRFSYVYGYFLAEAAGEYGNMDYSQIAQGVLDYASSSAVFSAVEMNNIMTEYQHKMLVEAEAERSAAAERNRKIADEFLANNGKRHTVTTLPSGLQYEVLEKGSGESAASAEVVTLDYSLTLADGTVADSSYERGQSATFSLSQVIPGFAEAVRTMCVGDRIRFWIPPELGYGEMGNSGIEPESLLIFDIKLQKIVQ